MILIVACWGRNNRRNCVQELKIHPSNRLKFVQYLPVNQKKVFVQNVTDETWQQDEWFKKVKLLVLLLHNQLVNQEHSLHFVLSTLVVLHPILLPNQVLIAKYDGIVEIEELRTVAKRLMKLVKNGYSNRTSG